MMICCHDDVSHSIMCKILPLDQVFTNFCLNFEFHYCWKISKSS